MKINKFEVQFVDKIPSELKDGIIYICISCNVVVHKCACGCGDKTVTPIDKKYGWEFIYDGQAITLRPSIGNFNIPCKSHYYIIENRVDWLDNYYSNNKKGLFNLIRYFFKK